MFSGKLVHCDSEGLLSPKEEEAYTLLAEGHDYETIGLIAGYKPRTARAHINHVNQKLGVINKTLAVTTGFIQGILTAAPIVFMAIFVTIASGALTQDTDEDQELSRAPYRPVTRTIGTARLARRETTA